MDCGQLLDYREEKPVWWAFFERCERMSLDELVEDAESIARLEPVGRPRPSKKSFEQTFRFPPQQYKLGVGDDAVDPVTRKWAGQIVELDDAHGTLVLRHGPKVPVPVALIPPGNTD